MRSMRSSRPRSSVAFEAFAMTFNTSHVIAKRFLIFYCRQMYIKFVCIDFIANALQILRNQNSYKSSEGSDRLGFADWVLFEIWVGIWTELSTYCLIVCKYVYSLVKCGSDAMLTMWYGVRCDSNTTANAYRFNIMQIKSFFVKCCYALLLCSYASSSVWQRKWHRIL